MICEVLTGNKNRKCTAKDTQTLQKFKAALNASMTFKGPILEGLGRFEESLVEVAKVHDINIAVSYDKFGDGDNGPRSLDSSTSKLTDICVEHIRDLTPSPVVVYLHHYCTVSLDVSNAVPYEAQVLENLQQFFRTINRISAIVDGPDNPVAAAHAARLHRRISQLRFSILSKVNQDTIDVDHLRKALDTVTCIQDSLLLSIDREALLGLGQLSNFDMRAFRECVYVFYFTDKNRTLII